MAYQTSKGLGKRLLDWRPSCVLEHALCPCVLALKVARWACLLIIDQRFQFGEAVGESREIYSTSVTIGGYPQANTLLSKSAADWIKFRDAAYYELVHTWLFHALLLHRARGSGHVKSSSCTDHCLGQREADARGSRSQQNRKNNYRCRSATLSYHPQVESTCTVIGGCRGPSRKEKADRCRPTRPRRGAWLESSHRAGSAEQEQERHRLCPERVCAI